MTAVVTGAGSGIGRATALALAGTGRPVVCLDLDLDSAAATAAAIAGAGGTGSALEVDVSDGGAVDAAAGTAQERHGPLAVWVNAAGIMRDARTVDLREAELDAVMAVNFKGSVFGSQAAVRRMIDNGGGAVVNVISAIVDAPQARMAAYGASKAALSHFSRTLATEVGKHGVRVNLVAPGWTRTPMTEARALGPDGVPDPAVLDDTEAMYAGFTPLRRAATPQDAAAAIVWLASDGAAFVTGQTVRPHGGATLPW